MSQRSLKRQNTASSVEEGGEPMDASPKRQRTRILNGADGRGHHPAPITRQSSSRSLHDKIPLPLAPEHPGHIFVFGSGDTGQLGLGDEMLTRKKPMPLKVLDDKEIVDIVCGGMHTLAITREGKLWSWGCNDQRALGRSGEEYEPGPVENLENIKIIKAACGDSISMALSDQGKLFCWGTYRSSEGALGFSKEQSVQSVPAIFEPLKNEKIVDIAAGSDHCLALTADGFVYGWGNGQQSQLGRRIIERRKKNGLIPERLALKHIKAIGCGSYHSFALSVTGELYVWGLNNYQQCGLWTEEDYRTPDVVTTPTVITSLLGKGDIKSVVAGEHHSLVLMESGEVYAFGRADSSQLGLTESEIEQLRVHERNGSAHKKAVGIPTRISTLSNVIQIDSGSNHAIAVDNKGQAFTWGFGEMMALGTGDEDDVTQPTLLTGQKLEGHKVLRVAAGAQHTVVLATPE